MERPGPPSTPVAVLGTGLMGAPIARRLHRAGFDVRAWDIDPEHLRALAEMGITTFPEAREATQGAEVVLTMLPDYDAVRDVMTKALRALAGTDCLWIQSSTVGLEGTRHLGEMAEVEGITYVDCPLLGTNALADAGGLTALYSGPRGAQELSRRVLDVFCERILWLGDTGRGSKLKLIMNAWILGLVALTAEAIALSEGLGFEPTTFLEMIRGGPFDVAQAHLKGTAMIEGNFAAALPLRWAAKDARLIVAAGNEAGIDLLMADAAATHFERARNAGHGDEDYSAVWYSLRPTQH
jgi:3-hydroxyisobutyrate dehydrogenase